ncbi:hypothetical protein IWQ56_001544 [Coemansia nantahalensis]|nr:hypothetical protein IWQ56_001544 [Coemansia nantahalensis]
MFVAGRKRKAQQVDAAAPGSRAQAPTGAAGSAPAIDDRQCARMELNRLLQLGADSTRERDYRVALDHFNRAAALAKNEGIEDARVYEARSRALFKVGDVGRAIDDAKHAIRANPGASGYTCLATILAETGKVASALKVIDDGLAAVDEQDPGFAYLKTLRMSAMYRLDPKCVLYLNLRTDPAMRLPPELVALVLCKLDVRALMRCRMVARHWRALIDTTPGLWSRPTYVSLTPEELLRRQMPVDRVLRWSISAQLAEIRVPYETHVDDAMVAAIASGAPKLRILDISGCVNVSVKSMFWAWNATLEDAQGSTALEELYLDDHPDVLELLVYSTRYRHFSGLRVLHIGTYLSTGITSYPRIDRLLDYYQRIPNRQVPFPALVELTLDASYIGSTDLHEALRDCFPTLERLHLSDCRNLDTQMLTSLIGAQQALPLTSLDLSRCLGVDAHGLVELVSRCRQLVHVNLSRTSADNTVLAALTEAMGMDDAAGVEVLLLEVTSVTGSNSDAATEALGGGGDSEYDEEELYVVATLPAGTIGRARSAAQERGDGGPLYALIDMDSEQPFLELEGSIYQGVRDELLGTAMLFDISENAGDSGDAGGHDAGEADARLVATTSQVVSFHHVRLTKRQPRGAT